MSASAYTTRSIHACFGGRQGFYSHVSGSTGTTMNFAVYQPPRALSGAKVPTLYYLAGLTCTEETFVIKAGAQRLAAELGLILVSCDTSPRGLNLPGEAESWDFGLAAGFYLDATETPWAPHYRMGSYVNVELPALIEAHFPALPGRRGLFGHSMGGHGALVSALRHPGNWQSLSALAPISHPSAVTWGQKAFRGYLGDDPAAWRAYDACELLKSGARFPGPVLVDQGLSDQFLAQLQPDALEAAASEAGQPLRLRRHLGYDHSYYFIQTFIHDHLAHHAAQLQV
ncbi:MAG: S-formylglutathione hydrolase [Nevskiaceae bacterium]|nr:MAG: S-formylglutathione hydrolase [Nevskiaceae bacterium]